MNGIMLACVEFAAFFREGGRSHILISYFDCAEERVLSERPAFTIPPA